jgi:hypothetical protein
MWSLPCVMRSKLTWILEVTLLAFLPSALDGDKPLFPLRRSSQCPKDSVRVCTNDVYSTKVEVNLRPTVSRPVCLGVRHTSGTRDQFFFLLEIFFRQLRVCYFVAPSLARGRASNLLVQLLLGLARAVTLRSKSRRTHGHILLSHLRLPEPGGPGPRIYIPQEQGGPAIPSGTGFPFCRLLRLAGLRWRYSNPPPHGSYSTANYLFLLYINTVFCLDFNYSFWPEESSETCVLAYFPSRSIDDCDR